jgi:hypothetical protein
MRCTAYVDAEEIQMHSIVRSWGIAGVAALLILSPSAASGTAVAGNAPQPPTLSSRGTVNIPGFSCYGVDQFASLVTHGESRVFGVKTTLWKSGLSVPVGTNKICGYMGSGTYRIDVAYEWYYKVHYKKQVDVTKPNPDFTIGADGENYMPLSFTCQQGPASAYVSEGSVGWFYSCNFHAPYQLGHVESGIDQDATAQFPAELAGAKYFHPYEYGDHPEDATMFVERPGSEPLPATFDGSVSLMVNSVEVMTGVDVPDEVPTGKVKWVSQWKWSKSVVRHQSVSVRVNVR